MDRLSIKRLRREEELAQDRAFKEEAKGRCAREHIVLYECYRSWTAGFTGCLKESDAYWDCFTKHLERLRTSKSESKSLEKVSEKQSQETSIETNVPVHHWKDNK